ncbi:universal stress protein [Streptomyces sp. TRM49041]|uniref:universal stress protein n=1 Tax=Streptomyces sp. TRM49041 TaxID=2603216 RepID=UPI0011EEBAE8|nr:universal stress protein [Streptomyces sp. TRM49041]
MAHAPTTRTIAAGVDGSPESLAAADWAAREAGLRTLPLRLVHAWLWQPLDVPLAQDREAEERRAQGVLDEAVAELRSRHPEVEVTAEVVSDTPVPALLAAADGAEMLVIGSRGHGALVGFLLGSYGQQVIAAATRPVVSVRAPQEAAPKEAGPAAGGGEIVVGQQGGRDESAAVLEFAFRTAAARGVGVRAVRAWSLPPLYAYSPGSLRLADEAGGLEPYERKALAEALAPWRERYPDVPVTEHVEIGSGGQVLLSVAGGAGLMVVGRRVRHAPLGPRIGSVAHAVLHHAPCPVAVVPHE